MKKIIFVTPPDTSHGFSLAGVKQLTATADDVQGTLAALAADPSSGLIAVDERLVNETMQRYLDVVERRWPALVVVLPAPSAAETPAEDYALRLIRRAIGYQVRVNV